MDTKSQLQTELARFFAPECFDTDRVREISDVHVSPVSRGKLIERLDRYIKYGKGNARDVARKLIAEVKAVTP